MASDKKKAETGGAKKAEPVVKDKSATAESTAKAGAGGAPKSEPVAKDKTVAAESSPKAEAETAAAPSSYSRGEGQKPVTKAYKENWNAIFAKKGVKRNAKKKKR